MTKTAKAKTVAVPAGRRMAQKAEFIRKLAGYLAGNPVGKSIALEVESKGGGGIVKWAQEWADVVGASGIFGYQTVEEAEAALWEFLG
jgi:hypothetical protein